MADFDGDRLSLARRQVRLTRTELARRIGVSAAAVTQFERNASRPTLPVVAELARQSEEVVECHRVTGDDCFVMTAHVRDVGHMEELIDRFAASGQTTTSVMQSAPVPRRGIQLT